MAITISFGNAQFIKTERNGKGKSIIEFPESYVVVDIETTGLSPVYDEIIEISAIRYDRGEEIDVFTTMIKPENEVDEYITELTGITNEMLEDAPSIKQCIGEFREFVGKNIIVGYNVNFDINFLYDNLILCNEQELGNDFIDVMRIARKVLPKLPHHRQKDIAEYFKISIEGSHRAKTDCEICKACFDALKNEIELRGISLDVFRKSYSHKGVSAKDISTEKKGFDEEHSLYGQVCVFTGILEKMQRKEAMQIVADLGGIHGDSVTKKTNFLILGNNDYCNTIKDGKSSKQKNAEKLILDGVDLQIISEQVFYDLIIQE